MGEGVYTFESRAGADRYRQARSRQVPEGVELSTVELQIAEKDFQTLRRMDLRGQNELAEEFVNRHSRLYGEGEAHSYQHVIRPTEFDAEHFFPKSVFHFFKTIL